VAPRSKSCSSSIKNVEAPYGFERTADVSGGDKILELLGTGLVLLAL
jgi:hypothetical protein